MMDRIFNMDNKFFSFMSRVADIFILNMLTLLCCLPVITIGPALTGLFYVTLKMVRNEETYIVKGFFKSFRENFKQALLINLIMLFAGVILALDFSITRSSSGMALNIMTVTCSMAFVLYMMVFVYIYPVLAKFYNTTGNTFRNAFLMALRHLPFTFLMILVTVSPVFSLFIPNARVQSLLFGFIFMFGIATVAFVNSFMLVRIFDKYIPESERTENLPADDFSFQSGFGVYDDPQTAGNGEPSPDQSGEEAGAGSGQAPGPVKAEKEDGPIPEGPLGEGDAPRSEQAEEEEKSAPGKPGALEEPL